MDVNNIWTVLVTLITTLSGTTAFRYYEKRASKREKDEDFIRNDCKDRISKLEALLVAAAKEKDEMRTQILELVSEVASLRTELKFISDQKNIHSIRKTTPK